MNAIKPIAVTEDSVTLAKSDYEALLEALEEAEDRARLRRVEADLAAGRTEELPWEMAEKLLEGHNPIRVWRTHRGLTASALAQAAGITPGFLSQLESGKKAGSAFTLKRLARELGVDMADLVAGER